MSYEYDASYRLGLQRSADLWREVELRRQIAERAIDADVEPPKKVPFWVWFRNPFAGAHRYRPASAL